MTDSGSQAPDEAALPGGARRTPADKHDPFASAEGPVPRFGLDVPDDDDDDAADEQTALPASAPAPAPASEADPPSAGEGPALPRTSGLGAVEPPEPARPGPAPAPHDPDAVLAAMGLDPEKLRAAAAEVEAARARGESIDPARMLAGAVSPVVLERLAREAAQGKEPRGRAKEGGKDGAKDGAREPGKDAREASGEAKRARGPSGRAGKPTPAGSPAARTPSDAAPGEKPRSRKVRRAPSDEAAPRGRGAERPSQRKSARVPDAGEPDPESTPALGVKLVKPDPERAPDPRAQVGLGEESETRRFDPDALAAASLRPTRHAPLAPLLGGALVVVVVGAVVAFWGPAPPPPPVELPRPATEPVEPETEAPPVTEAPPDPWIELAARASDLERAERYTDALDLLQRAPKAAEAHAAEAARTVERLRALEGFRRAAEPVFLSAKILQAAGRHAEAVAQLEALLADRPELEGSATGKRVAAAREAVLTDAARAEAAAPTGSTEPAPAPQREEPAERVAAFERLAARGRAVAGALQQRIARDKEKLVEARRAEVARVREATAASPLDLELAPGFVVRRAVVEALDDRGLTLRPSGSGDAITRAWAQIDPDVALRVRRLALRDGNADDLVRFGRWCLMQHLFDEGRAAFNKAVQLDPKKLDQVPDVAQFARAGRLFGGQVERSGQSLEVTWRFSRAGEGADFEDEPGARGVLREGRLEVRGRGAFFTAVKEVGFDGRVAVTADVGPTSRDALVAVGLAFGWGTRREVAWFAAVAKGTGDLLLLERRGGRAPRVLERKGGALKGADASDLVLEVEGDVVRVKAARRTQLKVDADVPWDESARVLVGGTAPGDGAASVDGLVLRGLVRPAWLRKATGEVDAMLRAALARAEELPVFAEPPGRPAPLDLSAEDAFGVAGVPQAVLEEYGRARARSLISDPVELLGAAASLDRVIDAAPTFAAALFRRGQVLRRLGRPQAARGDLERADQSCPRFYEAKAERARLLAMAGKLDEAAALADAAAALSPDYAPAQAARGIVAFCRGELEAASEALDLALALDPWNDELRGLRRNVAHVLAGPPWARTFRVETDHYVVETDIAQRRAEEYARELETVRRFYAQRFGVDDPAPEPARRAKVLIFDTREGFHAYAELTTDDRVESLLGYYLPRYRQLLLYEDKDDATLADTRRVLYHEAFHQFVDGRVADMPKWLDEGLAEFFGGCTIEGGRVARSGLVHEDRLRDVRRFVASGAGPVPFPRLMLESGSEFYSGAVAAKYAQAWSLIHYFELGAAGEVKERWRRYVGLLRQGAASKRAFEEAWSGVAWDELQTAWWAYVKAL